MQKKVKIISFGDYENDGEEYELDVERFKNEASGLVRWLVFSLYSSEKNLEQFDPMVNRLFLKGQLKNLLKLRDSLNVAAKETSIATATLQRIYHSGSLELTKSDVREIRQAALLLTEPLLNLMDILIVEDKCENY